MQYILFLVFLAAFSLSGYSQEPTKVDEFESIQCDDYLARIDNIVVQAGNDPTGKTYVFVYEGKTESPKYGRDGKSTSTSLLPQYGLADAKIRSMKKTLALRGAPVDRFVFLKAGFREKFTIEIWLAQNGQLPPKPTPTIEKMKYRKGKPSEFCVSMQ